MSRHKCVALTDQSVLEASIWDAQGIGGSYPRVKAFSQVHASLTTSTWTDMRSPGDCLRRREGWNDLSTFPRSPRAGSHLWGRGSGSPHHHCLLSVGGKPTHHVGSGLLCPVWDLLRRWWQWRFFGLQPPARVGEFGRETLEEVGVGTEPAPSTPCLACDDLSGNRSTSQVDELAAGHPAAGCSRPAWMPCVTRPCVVDRGKHH